MLCLLARHRLCRWLCLVQSLSRRHIRIVMRTVRPLRFGQDDQRPHRSNLLLGPEMLPWSGIEERQMPGLCRRAVQQRRHFLHRLLARYHLFLGCFAMYRLPRRHVRVFVRTVCPLRIRQDDEWPYGADFLLDQEVLAGSSSREWQMPELSRRAVQQGRHLLHRLLAW